MANRMSERMTCRDTAAHLRVAESVVCAWAQKGVIPCTKTEAAWCFKRSDVNRWLAEDFGLVASPSTLLTDDAALSTLVSPELIHFFASVVNKREALLQLSSLLAHSAGIKDASALTEGIFRREKLMSTGIGLGLAVPHVRLDSVSEITVALGICREPITDYESLDNAPVRLIFMIAAGAGQHTQYLRLLSQIAARLKKEHIRDAILAARSKDEALLILAGGE